MKVAIVYCTHHGTTEKVARLLAQKLEQHQVSVFDLGETPKPDIAPYDLVIIGGSIHVGMIQNKIKRFCEKNLEVLLEKEVGLFICCMLAENQKIQFERAYPAALRTHSKAHGYMGGEFKFEKMNFLEKLMVNVVAKTHESISRIHYASIDRFLQELELVEEGITQ
ncbi:flavodoxin domain-containing protein [Cesiribacter sp. SM1]|uniref:flavodoxin domain-containing protein n=1 Tax=Cesiribacter sp. SM1 TaxID=2861196 RepID=UPI001CD4D388|nr:flavodoxin domain-containing protein [Cesiribacter sp. SM1]